MGRPLAKRFFGALNLGTSGSNTSADADLAGQSVAGVGSITAGTYTAASTLQFPVPLLAGNGGVRATGTPTYTVVSAVVTAGGSGYANTATNFTVTSGGGTATINITPSGGALAGTVTIVSGGTFTALPGAAVAVVGGTGSSGTVTLTFGISGATITNAGDGYVTTSTAATAITASTAGAGFGATGTSLGTITVGTTGNFTFGTPAPAGTFWVGQVLTASGSISGTTWTGYTTGNNYIVSATNGTSTLTLVALTAATGLPTTAQATTAGTVTGLTLTTAGTVTVASTNGLVATGQKFVTTGTGGSSGVTAGTYHIIAVNPATRQISLAASYANFFTSTAVAITTAASIASTTGVGSQHLVININGGTGSGGAISAVLATASGSISSYGTAGEFGPAILASAFLPAGLKEYSDSDIVKQKGSRKYLCENPDGSDACLLTATTPLTAGYMTIGATDSVGNTYWVTKLTGRKVTLTRNVLASGQSWQFATDSTAQWVFSSPVASVSVVIDNA